MIYLLAIVILVIVLLLSLILSTPRSAQSPRKLVMRLCSTANLDLGRQSTYEMSGKLERPSWLELLAVFGNSFTILEMAYFFQQREAVCDPEESSCADAYEKILCKAITIRIAVVLSFFERLFMALGLKHSTRFQTTVLFNYLQIRIQIISLVEENDPSLLAVLDSRL